MNHAFTYVQDHSRKLCDGRIWRDGYRQAFTNGQVVTCQKCLEIEPAFATPEGTAMAFDNLEVTA